MDTTHVVEASHPLSECEDQILHEHVFREVQEGIAKNGDGIWIEDLSTGETILRSEIIPLSRKAASALTRLGFGQGDLLMMMASNVVQYWIPVFGAWQCGGWITPAVYFNKSEQIASTVLNCKPKVIVCDAPRKPVVLEAVRKTGDIVKHVVVIGEDSDDESIGFQTFLDDDGSAFPENVVLDKVCGKLYLCYSSGTVGSPKGIVHTQGGLAKFFMRTTDKLYRPFFEKSGKREILFGNFFFHATGITMSLITLKLGITGLAFSNYVDEEQMAKAIEIRKPAVVSGYPHQIATMALSLSKKYDLSSMKVFFTGGSPTTVGMQLRILESLPTMECFGQGYGMSECFGVCGVNVTTEFARKLDKNSSIVGYLIDGMRIMIVDSTSGKSLGPNQVGELYVKSPYCMTGYYCRPEETSKTLVGNGWMRTGDVGFYSEDKALFFVEREKELLKYKTHQVAPLALEAVILQHPGVVDAAVSGVPDPIAGDLPMAFVVKKAGSDVTAEEIEKFVAARVSENEQLRGGVRFLDVVPRNANGKILRRELRQKLMN